MAVVETEEWATLTGGPRDGALTSLQLSGPPPETYWIPLQAIPVFPGDPEISPFVVQVGPRIARYRLIRRFDLAPSRDDRGCLRYEYAGEDM